MVGNKVTSNHQLDAAGKRLFGSKYHGTYPSDQFPILNKAKPYAIINTHPLKSGGEHWLGIARMNNGRLLVYDSFGRKTKSIFKGQFHDEYDETESDAEQTKRQYNCGARALSFLKVFNAHGSNAAKQI